MEESVQQDPNSQPSYWMSVGIASLVFGIIYFLLTLIWGYYSINSEPTGSVFTMVGQALGSGISCLVGGFGGMLAIWHYANTYDKFTLKIGQGALFGFYSALGIVVISTVLNQIWNLIDPTFTDKLMESMIDNYEQMDELTQAQKNQIIDGIASEFRKGKSFLGILKGMVFSAIPLSIVNIFTGMIGVKIFGKEEN